MMQYLLRRAVVVSVALAAGFADGFLLPYIVDGIENLASALLELPLGYMVQGKS